MGELGVDLFHPLHVHLWGWVFRKVFNCVSVGIFGKIVDSVCVCVCVDVSKKCLPVLKIVTV